ncbi:hypothetical protein ACH5RR_007072 [Cinchona calisaya]|uniref:Uncharacterized protein n=1 Tax=Cinchona calisaya TaxID=153742 RepID=A0ABD3AQS1_9GENT
MEIEAYRKALEAKIEKLNNEKAALDEVNNKLMDKVLEERHQTHEYRTNRNFECNVQEHNIKEQDMAIRELKRKLMEVEERMWGEADLSKKIKLSLKELQDNVVPKITEAEVNTELRLMKMELRIQELHDHLNPLEMEAHGKALEAKIEKLNNEKAALDEVNNKLLDKSLGRETSNP